MCPLIGRTDARRCGRSAHHLVLDVTTIDPGNGHAADRRRWPGPSRPRYQRPGRVQLVRDCRLAPLLTASSPPDTTVRSCVGRRAEVAKTGIDGEGHDVGLARYGLCNAQRRDHVAPVDIPAKIPSSEARRRAICCASSLRSCSIESTSSSCHRDGTKPTPIPSMRCAPVVAPDSTADSAGSTATTRVGIAASRATHPFSSSVSPREQRFVRGLSRLPVVGGQIHHASRRAYADSAFTVPEGFPSSDTVRRSGATARPVTVTTKGLASAVRTAFTSGGASCGHRARWPRSCDDTT